MISVNVSRVREAVRDGRTWRTGIFKTPVSGSVRIGRLGLEGDEQGDQKHHGGVDQAVYAYTTGNYAHWRQELRRDDLPHGQFGENLTLEGLDPEDGGIAEDAVCIGDVFRFGGGAPSGGSLGDHGGGAVLQVSAPRAPCATLAMAMGDKEFVKAFLASGRIGFYLRVLQEGVVAAGDTVERVSVDPARLSVREATNLMYFGRHDVAGAARAAGVSALKAGWREKFAERAGGSRQHGKPR